MTNRDPSQHRASSTIATWAAAIERALNSYACEKATVDALFADHAIDQSRLMDANYRIPVVVMTKLWRSSVILTGDDAFGLRVAESVSPTTFHALGYAAMASKNFTEAVQRVIRNARLVSDIANLKLDMGQDKVCLYFNVRDDSPDVSYEAIDAFMASLIHITRHYMHTRIPLLAVEMVRPEPKDRKRFDDFFEIPVTFNGESNSFSIHSSVIPALVPTYNAMLLEANEKVMEEYLRKNHLSSTTDIVRSHIEAVLPEEPVLERMAERMHMSERKLQRLLTSESTSYQKVLDAYRQEKAEQWLNDAGKSIKQVSDLLGFGNQSAFTRAFKRWTGKTPKQMLR